jgi:catechol 2,3-dioxygenase-like lactoylglutathione lyase family enzyme
MNQKVSLHHVALHCGNKDKAALFFTQILQIPKVKSFSVSSQISQDIFGVDESVAVDVYDNGRIRFEIFITKKQTPTYIHTCLEVTDSSALLKRCNKNGLQPIVIKKDGKDLVFIKDFSNNLYEIKEKKRG